MEAANTLSYFSMLVGMAIYGWVSFFRRLPGAPGVGGGGRRFMWQGAEWFSARHYRIRTLGFWLWLVGCVGVALTSFIRR